MRPQLNEIKLLEDFLNDHLPEDQTQEIEIRLLWDTTWQQALAQQQLAYQALRATGRQQLRLELKTIHTRLFT